MATSHTSRTSRILGPDGQPLQLPDLDEPQTARLAHLQRELQSHPTRGLTPSKLARILDAAETGDMTAQFELFEDMEEKDGHIASEMNKRRRACILDWQVVPPEKSPSSEASSWATEWRSEPALLSTGGLLMILRSAPLRRWTTMSISPTTRRSDGAASWSP